MRLDDPAYPLIIKDARRTLGDAGFSEAEVESWVREYDKDIQSGKTLACVEQRIQASARARSKRLAEEHLRRPIQPRGEGLLDDKTYIGLTAGSYGLLYLGGCIYSGFTGDDSTFLMMSAVGVAAGLPMAALVGLALCEGE